MSLNGTNVKDLDDATKEMETASLTKTIMLGLYRTQATAFHGIMPVDANNARRYRIKINSLWEMSIRQEDMDSKQCFIA